MTSSHDQPLVGKIAEEPTASHYLERALGRAVRAERWESARMILMALEAEALENNVAGSGRKVWDQLRQQEPSPRIREPGEFVDPRIWEPARRQPPTPPGEQLGAGLCEHGARADSCPLEHNGEPIRVCVCGGKPPHRVGIDGCEQSGDPSHVDALGRRRSCHCGGVNGWHAPGIYGCITSTQHVDPQ